MSNTLAQNPTVSTYSGAASVAKAFGSAMTNPSRIVAMFTMENYTGSASCADDKNAGSYDVDKSQATVNSGGGRGIAYAFSKENTQTAATTVTVTLTGGNSYGILKVYELTSGANAPVLDASGSSTGESATRTVQVTPLIDNCSVFAAWVNYGGGTLTNDANYTTGAAEWGGSFAYHYSEYRIDAGTAGLISINAAATGASTRWAAVAVAYKSGSGGSGVTIPIFINHYRNQGIM